MPSTSEHHLDTPVVGLVGLGSNLGDPPAQLDSAMTAIDRLAQTRVTRPSAFYESSPMGVISQPSFINAVIQIRTRLPPLELLAEFHKIERRQGRIRNLRWGPRTLDLDILVYGEIIMERRELVIPHPGIPFRAFVLYPLLDIAPRLCIPGMGTPASLLKGCPGPVPRRLPGRRRGNQGRGYRSTVPPKLSW